jgi:hypothetical protein
VVVAEWLTAEQMVLVGQVVLVLLSLDGQQHTRRPQQQLARQHIALQADITFIHLPVLARLHFNICQRTLGESDRVLRRGLAPLVEYGISQLNNKKEAPTIGLVFQLRLNI